MIDQPSASELLEAMQRTLTRDVMPACDGSARHAARVVANLCAIVAREFEIGAEARAETSSALAAVLDADPDTDLGDLAARLDELLCGDTEDAFDDRVYELLLADARRRLAIDKPDYA